jgi:hypothetical protein
LQLNIDKASVGWEKFQESIILILFFLALISQVFMRDHSKAAGSDSTGHRKN